MFILGAGWLSRQGFAVIRLVPASHDVLLERRFAGESGVDAGPRVGFGVSSSSAAGDQSSARIAFPAVFGCVGELGADDVEGVVNLVHHRADLFRDLEEAV